jgi:hypothetical protein
MTTWSPTDKSASITLSNGNLTASGVTVNNQCVRSTTSRNSGIFAFEITMNAGISSFGICNSSLVLTTGAGGNSFIIYQNGTTVRIFSASANADVSVITATMAVNDVWTIIVDYPNLTMYTYRNGTGFAGNFPARTGGIGINSGQAWFAYFKTLNHNPDTVTAAYSSLITLPSGASEWDVTAAAPFIFPRSRHYVRR